MIWALEYGFKCFYVFRWFLKCFHVFILFSMIKNWSLQVYFFPKGYFIEIIEGSCQLIDNVKMLSDSIWNSLYLWIWRRVFIKFCKHEFCRKVLWKMTCTRYFAYMLILAYARMLLLFPWHFHIIKASVW